MNVISQSNLLLGLQEKEKDEIEKIHRIKSGPEY